MTLRDVFQVSTWPMWCSSRLLLQRPDATATTLPLQFQATHTTGSGGSASAAAVAEAESDLGGCVRRT